MLTGLILNNYYLNYHIIRKLWSKFIWSKSIFKVNFQYIFRLILASASLKFLRPLLLDSISDEISVVIVPDISRDDLTRILDVVYRGETRLGPNYTRCLDLLAWLEIPLDRMVVEMRQKPTGKYFYAFLFYFFLGLKLNNC